MDIATPSKNRAMRPLWTGVKYGTALFTLVAIPTPMIGAIIGLTNGYLNTANIAERIILHFEDSRYPTKPSATSQ